MNITPGQWSINDWPQRDSSIRIGAPGTPCIAVIPLQHVSINEQKGNARLIAPRMLGALNEFLLCGENAGHNQDLIGRVREITDAINEVT